MQTSAKIPFTLGINSLGGRRAVNLYHNPKRETPRQPGGVENCREREGMMRGKKKKLTKKEQ
jgi:hypothetical protein